MPMSFPDMVSLERAAEMWKFRKSNDGETEESFREALADFVVTKDPVESMEIRTGKGWDNWNPAEKKESLRKTLFAAPPGTIKAFDEHDASEVCECDQIDEGRVINSGSRLIMLMGGHHPDCPMSKGEK